MTLRFRFRLSLRVFLSIPVRGAGISLFRRVSVRGTIRISSDWGCGFAGSTYLICYFSSTGCRAIYAGPSVF